jgi:thymidylate synthase (FAD)
LKALEIGHHSIIEHPVITVKAITDRGVTHEIVRHRIASYSQESTRYCNYSKGRFGKELTVILPVWFYEEFINDEKSNSVSEQYMEWMNSIQESEASYLKLSALGQSAQQARSVLPNSLKTEIIMTYNIREWRHFFKLRNSDKAHPQMEHLAEMMQSKFRELVPILFD